MRDQYRIEGETVKRDWDFEKQVAETLEKMAKYMKMTESELMNTALKRFIATHKDFLPPKRHKG